MRQIGGESMLSLVPKEETQERPTALLGLKDRLCMNTPFRQAMMLDCMDPSTSPGKHAVDPPQPRKSHTSSPVYFQWQSATKKNPAISSYPIQ
jgi:hypothetical protein